MTTNNNALPDIARDEWRAARKELLTKEKELTRQRDALNAERRRLPMVEIDKDYVFESPDGEATDFTSNEAAPTDDKKAAHSAL